METAVMEQKNQLQVIVDESGLETTKAKVLLEKFRDYFDIAAEWETKAKTLVVTNEFQTAEMAMARTGRLFLRDKRLSVEKCRKELKEQSLREGKAIDGIANVLKSVIVPIEEYLEKQEKFVEIRADAEREAKRLEIERRMALEEEAERKKQAEEQERIRLENIKLKAEAEEREKAAELERQKQAKILSDQKAKADAERKAIEDKARKEIEAAELSLRVEREKAEKEKRATEEKARKEREAAELERKAFEEKTRKEKALADAERKKLEEQLKNMIECPNCHHKFSIKGE